jgi:hypothetical protein
VEGQPHHIVLFPSRAKQRDAFVPLDRHLKQMEIAAWRPLRGGTFPVYVRGLACGTALTTRSIGRRVSRAISSRDLSYWRAAETL